MGHCLFSKSEDDEEYENDDDMVRPGQTINGKPVKWHVEKIDRKTFILAFLSDFISIAFRLAIFPSVNPRRLLIIVI